MRGVGTTERQAAGTKIRLVARIDVDDRVVEGRTWKKVSCALLPVAPPPSPLCISPSFLPLSLSFFTGRDRCSSCVDAGSE